MPARGMDRKAAAKSRVDPRRKKIEEAKLDAMRVKQDLNATQKRKPLQPAMRKNPFKSRGKK